MTTDVLLSHLHEMEIVSQSNYRRHITVRFLVSHII